MPVDFEILVNIVLFMFFLVRGFDTEHNFSGGFMIFLSGWILLALSLLSAFRGIMHPVYILPLLAPFGIYLVWRGSHKMFYEDK